MMLATNWGIYEITQRHAEFIEDGDNRDMEIRTRSDEHLILLRAWFPELSETLAILDGTADFPYRVFITRDGLARLLASLPDTIDYVQFKKDAKDPVLHRLLDRMWTSWLNAFPRYSRYSKFEPVTKQSHKGAKKTRRYWWEDL